MRNLLLVARREYLDRVRKRSFLLVTILVPLAIGALVLLPGKLMMSHKVNRHIMVVTESRDLANAISQQLTKQVKDQSGESDRDVPVTYVVETSTDLSDANHARLRERVSSNSLDGFLWMPEADIAKLRVTYTGRELGDILERSVLRGRVSSALLETRLAKRGIAPDELREMMKSVVIDGTRIDKGKESKGGAIALGATFALALLLYMSLLLYGVAVMRAIVEEKSSRVMEVLLSSVTPRDLMGGKILGVGAVGLTQVGIWLVLAGAYAGPGVAAMMSISGGSFKLEPTLLVFYAVYFLLGYMMYSTLYAAVGASVNTDQEGQQFQMIVSIPLIISITVLMPVIRAPHSGMATFMSIFPFTSPVIMFARMSSTTVPAWQIGLSIGLLLATIYALLWLCARIYRVGILMYGKRPTLPEIIKWVRYAGA